MRSVCDSVVVMATNDNNRSAMAVEKAEISLLSEQVNQLGFQIRPPLSEKFKSLAVKEIIRTVLDDELMGKIYDPAECENWTKNVVSNVEEGVRQLGFQRYKFVVQTILGEQRGSGVKIGARCLWDADTDNFASENFLNVSEGGKLGKHKGALYCDSYLEYEYRIAYLRLQFKD